MNCELRVFKLHKVFVNNPSIHNSRFDTKFPLDVDMVSNLKQSHVKQLVKILEPSYTISEKMILDAIESRSSFNVIHLETMLKVDVFVLKEPPFHQECFGRRRKDTIDEDDESIELYLGTAEDIILHKLDWYCQHGQKSERQWLDIPGIIKVQQNQLDLDYLKNWSNELGLMERLQKVFAEAGIEFH